MTPSSTDRRARLAISAVFFVLGASLGAWAPHIATVKLSLNLSGSVLGTALLAGTFGAVTTMPFASFVIHRFGSRAGIMMSSAGLLLVLPFLVLAPNLFLFAATLYVMGIFYGHFDVAMNTHSLVVQERFDRPILSAIHGFFSIGGFAAGAGAAIAAKLHVSPSVHLTMNSLIMAGILACSFPHLLPKECDHREEGEGPKFALPRGVLLPLGILTIFSFMGEGALWDWAAVYMRTTLGTDASLAAVGFAVLGLGMAIGRFVGDPFVHRFGPRAVLVVSGLLATAGLLASISLPFPAVAIFGFSLCGLGLANLVPILFAASGRQPGFTPGYALAAVTTCGYSGFLLGPPLIGYIADLRSLAASFALIAALTFAVSIFGPRYVRD